MTTSALRPGTRRSSSRRAASACSCRGSVPATPTIQSRRSGCRTLSYTPRTSDRGPLVEGIRLGRSWLAESAGVSLELIVENGGRRAGLGERLSVRDDASVNITAAVGGAPETCVRILTDQGQMIRQGLDAGGAVRWLTTPGQAAYVRAEVRRTADIGVRGLPYGSMVAMTNPVFLGRMPSAGSSASTVSTAPPLRRNSSSTCEPGRCRPRHRSGRPARSRSTRRPGRPGVLPHRRQNRRGPGHRQPERHAGRLAHQHRPGHHSLHRPAGHCPGPAGPSPPRGEVAP